MGADMLLALAASPITASGAPVTSVAELCIRVQERVTAAFSGEEVDAEFYEELLEGGSGKTTEILADALTSWLRDGGLQSREVAHLRISDRTYVATGGLSWGDAPTDAFSYVCLLDDIHAFDEPLG